MADSRTGVGFNTWLIVGALLTALAVPRAASRDVGRGESAASKAESPHLVPELAAAERIGGCSGAATVDDLQRLTAILRRLLGDATGAAWKTSEASAAQVAAQLRELQHPLFPLVASVPDPRRDHGALHYDQALVSLRQAAARLGFVQDRFALPWQASAAPSNLCVRRSPNGDLSVETRPPPRLELPGLMSFRNQQGAILLLILVSESPVSGVAVPQLKLAFQLQREIAGADRPLAILGPTFSGSVRSYIDALRDAAGPCRVTMITGTATSPSVDADLNAAFRHGGSPRELTFSRTVPTDDVLEQWTIRQLCTLHPRARFAAWRELGTGYGGTMLGEPASNVSPCGSPEPRVNRVFRFPLLVSKLRQQHEQTDAESPGLSPALRRTLSLGSSSAGGNASDIPQAFSSRSAFVDELTLAQQLSRICDERYRYLFIEATDPNDVVFLATQVRRYCRRPTLVTLGHEELFTHPDLQAAFSGTLVASASPPSLALADLWNAGRCSTPESFPNSVSEGYFNAALALAHAIGIDPVVPGAHQAAALCTTAPGGAPGQPPWPLFLSAITGSGTWPMRVGPPSPKSPLVDGGAVSALLEVVGQAVRPVQRSLTSLHGARSRADIEATENRREQQVARAPGLPSAGARLLAWPFVVGGLLLALARGLRGGIFRRCSGDWQWQRKVRLVVAELSACLVVSLAALPFWTELWLVPQNWQLRRISWLVGLGALGALLLLSASLWDLGHLLVLAARGARKRLRHWFERPGLSDSSILLLLLRLARRYLVGLGTLLGGAVFAILVLAWMSELWASNAAGLPSEGRALVVLRLLNPFAVSPAVPLLCISAGALLWTGYSLCRLTRLDRFASQPAGLAQRWPLRELRDLWTELYWPWTLARAWLVVLLISAFTCWRILAHRGGSFEGTSYDWAFGFGFFGLNFLVAAEIVRFLTLSRLLIDACRALAAQPMVGAYNRVSQKVCGSFGLQLSARVPHASELMAAGLSSRVLGSLARELCPGEKPTRKLRREAQALEEHLDRLRKTEDVAGNAERGVHDALFESAIALHEFVGRKRLRRAAQLDVKQLGNAIAPKDLIPGGANASASTFWLLEAASATPDSLYLHAAEDFVALRISSVFYQVLHELRHTLSFALVGALLLVISVLGYPFESGQALETLAWSVVTLVILAGLWQMLALEKNELLSRISGSRPERIEWNANLVHQLVLFVALPLAVVLLGNFPGLGDAFAHQFSTLARIASFAN